MHVDGTDAVKLNTVMKLNAAMTLNTAIGVRG